MFIYLLSDVGNFSLSIPVSLEEHEMDVTAYDYLMEYYPLISKALQSYEGDHSLLLTPEPSDAPNIGRMNTGDDSLVAGLFRHRDGESLGEAGGTGCVGSKAAATPGIRERIAMFRYKVNRIE